MLLIHQAGSVKIGEVVRYTLTYNPSQDRILPTPAYLHVRIKNTSAIPLRAAYLHGPYTLHVSAAPASFDPNTKVENAKRDGVPDFEPYLKAGGSWTTRLVVPAGIRETGLPDRKAEQDKRQQRSNGEDGPSATWIIEITSQIIFSNSASVGFELLVGRDERSLELGFAAVASHGHGEPGHLHDHQQGKGKKRHHGQAKGIYSRSISLVVDDTESLWNQPPLPTWESEEKCDNKSTLLRTSSWSSSRTLRKSSGHRMSNASETLEQKKKRQKKVHLVILTHGLHSNLGADMLYMKESIDAAASEAREKVRAERREAMKSKSTDTLTGRETRKDAQDKKQDGESSDVPESEPHETTGDDAATDIESDSDDEMVIVRGFNRNSVRTERGIQYLGKRLAKYVLELTYPDQPVLPVKRSVSSKFSSAWSSSSSAKDKSLEEEGIPAHSGSTIRHPAHKNEKPRAYRYTSISFVGHSLGGVVQTYAIAYIRKHSPTFFDVISPINFVCMASPLLGLSNENPVYVKFALDFGLVGRTGQDLGLTWRAPTLAKSGWSAMGSVFGAAQKDQGGEDPGAKPLLRILPTGPAHLVLHLFRNRTVYSNVVNDGIVPLRTSCLLFLDWKGLGRVEKARRGNGLIGTMASWGYAELMGQNTSTGKPDGEESDSGIDTPTSNDPSTAVPQPSEDMTNIDDAENAAAEVASHSFMDSSTGSAALTTSPKSKGPFDTLWGYIRPSGKLTKTDKKMFTRSQTVIMGELKDSDTNGPSQQQESQESTSKNTKRAPATLGESFSEDPSNPGVPPKTTVFESASDLLNPPLPPRQWITDPSSRARTIFHDRVYHPEDIPPPPLRKPRTGRSFSSDASMSASVSTVGSQMSTDNSGMRVEEKIARAYHKDLSWRKVLVRLEPDAHNNIIVRRKYANAYGWPVVKHVCDTHFAATYSAQTRDEYEPALDRAPAIDRPVTANGEEVKGQVDEEAPNVTEDELRERPDELNSLHTKSPVIKITPDVSEHLKRRGTSTTIFDDSYLDDRTSDEEDDDDDSRTPFQRFLAGASKPNKDKLDQGRHLTTERPGSGAKGTSQAEIAEFLTASPVAVTGHRGLGLSNQEQSPLKSTSDRGPDAESSARVVNKTSTASPSTLDPRSSVMSPGKATEVGLRRSIDEAINSAAPGTSSDQPGGIHGVSEQVARITSSKE